MTTEQPQDGDAGISLIDLMTWIGRAKWRIAGVTVLTTALALGYALTLPLIYTARTTLMPPGSQQQASSAAALAALGGLGGLAGSLGGKTPDEMYVALLRSDSVQRSLIDRFRLRERYKVETYEAMRRVLPQFVRVASDKKSGLITVEVDDREPAFAAELANAHATEITRVLGRLAVSEAQQRRRFFEQQLQETKETLIKAEQDLRKVQEKSGVIMLDKQAEALIGGAAQLRAQIAEREVQLKVLRTTATPQNPDVQRLNSELRALRSELARMESSKGGDGSAIEMPVGRIPEAAIDYVRARRELKLQETLLESMIRQFEMAKLDEAKEGPILQQVDVALPPDFKSKPSRALITISGFLIGLLLMTFAALWRGLSERSRERHPERTQALRALSDAWALRRR